MPKSDREDGWVEIGRVVKAHGLSGSLLVQLHGDDPENLAAAGEVQLNGRPGESGFAIRSLSYAGSAADGRARIRLTLARLSTREAAELWKGAALSIPESALQQLPEGEYYWRDLLGLRCRTLAGELLGTVEEIWPTGSNDVLVVRGGDTQRLIPALRSVLVRVDSAQGELWIDLPPGVVDAGNGGDAGA